MKTRLFFTGLAIMAATTFATAQDGMGKGRGQCNGTGKCSSFVDNNKNGVCDNYESRAANGKGNGHCNRHGQGKGKNFVDANKNGVCDNKEGKK